MDASTRRLGFKAVTTTARLMWSETDSYAKRRFVLSFLFLVAFSALSALLPVLYKLIIDGLTGNPSPGAIFTPLALIGALVVFQFVMRGSGELRSLVHGLATQRLSRRLSVRFFQHVFSLPLDFHLNRQTGAIGEVLGQGLAGCHILLQHLVFTFLPVVVEFLAIAIVLVHLGLGEYLVLLTVSAAAYGWAFARGARRITEPSEAVAAAQIAANSNFTDSLLNYETVKYFGSEGPLCRRFDDAIAHIERTNWGLLRLKTANGLLVITIFSISLGAALGLAGYDVLRGAISVGDFVLINTYVARLVQPLETIGYAVRDIAQGLGFLQQMLGLLDEKPEADSSGAHGTSPSVKGELTFEHVSLTYGNGRQVLNDVSFTVPAGHTVALVGTSGSGKSSLVRLLFRLYEPNSGCILLDGQPISEMPLERLRTAIAIVPQDTVLFNDSIGMNIALGKQGATAEEVRRAAEVARLDKFIDSLPHGFDTQVGERGLKLSGGEKQRIAIARAALKGPRIFVFDEATSSLDSRTERAILENLEDLSKACTTLVIAHRLSTVIHADEILVLSNGALIERGTHAALLDADGHYAELWRVQQSGRKGSQEMPLSIVQTGA